VTAWLGPAIGPRRFEVGGDVHAAFCDGDGAAAACFVPHRDGKWLADLYELARQRLRRAGVTAIAGGGYCTMTESARFFSYRGDKDTGRMATLVWLAPGA
jgi:copper oxidase (laccase) domain-containing protein